MRGAFITAAAAANRVLVLRAFFGVGFEYSLKDLLDRLDCLRERRSFRRPGA